jgi:hypothetical protein
LSGLLTVPYRAQYRSGAVTLVKTNAATDSPSYAYIPKLDTESLDTELDTESHTSARLRPEEVPATFGATTSLWGLNCGCKLSVLFDR